MNKRAFINLYFQSCAEDLKICHEKGIINLEGKCEWLLHNDKDSIKTYIEGLTDEELILKLFKIKNSANCDELWTADLEDLLLMSFKLCRD